MNFNEFCSEVKESVLDYFPQEYQEAEVSIQTVTKDNSVVLHGLTIRQPGRSIVPALYLEGYYNPQFSSQEFQAAIADIAAEYQKYAEAGIEVQPESIVNFEKVKEQIVPKILKANQNKALLAERPHTAMDDLAVFYQVMLKETPDGSMSIPVTNELAERWGVTADELHMLANENSERLSPAQLANIEDMMFGEGENYFDKDGDASQEPLLVLTNTTKQYGAAVIANPKVLEKVANAVGGDYYMLPSSIHEVLICPKDMAEKIGMTPKALGQIVRQVNGTEVSKDDRLSDHVYVYNREAKCLGTVKESMQKSRDMER